MSHVQAKFVFEGDTVFEVDLPAQGKLSDSIAELRKQSGTFLTTFLTAHNQSTEDVDVMEETVEDDHPTSGSGKGKKQQGGGGKRKR